MIGEPIYQPNLEFFWSCADRATVICVGNFPKDNVRIRRSNLPGMSYWDIAIVASVNKEDGNVSVSDGILRRDFLQVETVFPVHVEEGDVHDRTQNASSYPRSGVEWLPHSIVCNFAQR